MARYQLDNAILETLRDISDDVAEAEFVPYACLFNKHSLLTKNGELLQIIKITGFSFEALHHDEADLRSVIRRAVQESIQDDSYAVWFTTLRRRRSLASGGHYPDAFSKGLNEAWCERNHWDRKFINELYITVVREGQTADITSVKGFFQGLIGSVDRKLRNAYLDESIIALEATVNTLLGKLQSFGARRLTSVKRDGVYYGEHLEFLEKLINLKERPMPLSEVGLSDYLTSGELSFAYNAMEVRTAEGERRFGAMLTVKEYKEASLKRIDEILHLPCEFIVTQCVDFVHSARALKAYKEQQYYMRLSKDTTLAAKSELLDLLKENGADRLNYCEQQTTIFVLADSVKEMEQQTARVRSALSAIGIISVREDIWFEDTYWAMLPANFPFVSRLGFMNIRNIAGFANIQNFPAGNATGSVWGAPVTLFYTASGTPYFFNFHHDKVGHSLIVGPHGSGKRVLLHFLLSEARQFQNRLFYCDASGTARAFIEALGGNYYQLADASGSHFQLAPLQLADTPSNRDFLKLWLACLIDPSGARFDEAALLALARVVEQLYGMPPEQRNLPQVVDALVQAGAAPLAGALSRWHGIGDYGFLFDNPAEQLAMPNGVAGFDVSQLLPHPEVLIPVVSYLLHRMTITLDGSPAIVVLDEAWQLLHNPLFAPRIKEWLDFLTSRNALCIMLTGNADEAASYPHAAALVQATATQIYLPNDAPEDAYQSLFGLSEDECDYLEAMSTEYRHFLLKRKAEKVIGELNLSGLNMWLDVLSGRLPEVENTEPEEPEADVQAPQHLAMQYGET